MDWLSAAIEEYKTLREECLMRLKNQQSILTFGTAIIGLIISAAINSWEKYPLPEIIFLFLVPTVIYLIIMIWLGEVARMFRAGRFLCNVEDKINKQLQGTEKALTWENWLRTQHNGDKTPHYIGRIQSISIFLLFIVISFTSTIIGNYKILGKVCFFYIVVIDTIEAIALFLIIFFTINIAKQFYRD